MRATNGRRWKKQGRVRRVTLQASIVDAIREIVAMNEIPYTASIARYLGKHPTAVSRELQKMWQRGRVVKGERIGSIVPYYVREAAPR